MDKSILGVVLVHLRFSKSKEYSKRKENEHEINEDVLARKEAAINILRSTSISPLDVAGARGQYLWTPRTSTGGLAGAHWQSRSQWYYRCHCAFELSAAFKQDRSPRAIIRAKRVSNCYMQEKKNWPSVCPDVRLILVLALGRQIVYGQNTVYLCLSKYIVF